MLDANRRQGLYKKTCCGLELAQNQLPCTHLRYPHLIFSPYRAYKTTMDGLSPTQRAQSNVPTIGRVLSRGGGSLALAAPEIQTVRLAERLAEEKGLTTVLGQDRPNLSTIRKWFLLFVLSLAQVIILATLVVLIC